MRGLRRAALLAAALVGAACEQAAPTATSAMPSPATQPAAPAVAPGGTQAGQPGRYRLTYATSGGDVYVDDLAGSRRAVLSTGECSPPRRLEWSADGSLLGCLTGSGMRQPGKLVVANGTGQVIATHTNVLDFAWAPTGSNLLTMEAPTPDELTVAVRVRAGGVQPLGEVHGRNGLRQVEWREVRGRMPIWSHDARVVVFQRVDGRAALFDIASGQTQPIGDGDAWPLAWLAAGPRVLLATAPAPGLRPRYQVVACNLATHSVSRLPELDNSVDFWVSPTGNHVVYGAPTAAGTGGPSLALLDTRAGTARVLPAAPIGYPSDHLPEWLLRFTPDGTVAYWYDADRSGQLFKLDVHQGTVTKLWSADTPAVMFSPDGRKVALLRAPSSSGAGQRLEAADTETNAPRFVDSVVGAVAWRLP